MPEQWWLRTNRPIRHPLDIHRIGGDARNSAGSCFVAIDMFGH